VDTRSTSACSHCRRSQKISSRVIKIAHAFTP
jgi:hypothetical protein